MTAQVQVADISGCMFDLSENEFEVLVSQSVTPSENRNAARLPEQFRFQLTQSENEQRVTDCDRFANLKHSRWFAFPRMEISHITMLARVNT